MKKLSKFKRLILLVFLPVLFLAGQGVTQDVISNPLEKKAAIIIAENDFRDEELLKPKLILENHGIKVTIFSTTLKEVAGMLGATIKPDLLIKDLDVADYDVIIFVGGMGASQYWFDATAHRIAQKTVEAGKVLCAICIAPVTLANAGVLSGKKATVWRSEMRKLTEAGAIYTGAPVQVDGDIITADGPRAAQEFANTIIKILAQR
jgi:protease I